MRRLDLVKSRYYTVACIVFVSVFFMFSCSSEATFEKQKVDEKVKIEIPQLSLSLAVEDGRISFDNEKAFLSAVDIMKNGQNNDMAIRSSGEKKTGEETSSNFGYKAKFPNSETMSKYGFYSLYDDFIVAMKEAESYYDREGGYEEFKKKHPSLYFPEMGDDYSAYLPVSDKEIAKLLDVNGEISIGGKIVNLIDINSYDQLKELGIVPKDESEWVILRSSPVSTLNDFSEVKTRTTVLPEVHCNDRKLWINCSYKSPGLLVEVCFRKKGLFGAWYNYDSVTHMNITFYAMEGYISPITSYPLLVCSGCSSHDLIHPRISSYKFIAQGWVTFQGFGAQCGSTQYHFYINMD